MSILIKGMDMPKSCNDCWFYDANYEWCKLLDDEMMSPFSRRDIECPLIELPPHGRLVDANALSQNWMTDYICPNCGCILHI